jgi:SAM-dependent methyltransferase
MPHKYKYNDRKLTGLPYRLAYYVWVRSPHFLTRRLRSSSHLMYLRDRLRDALARGGGRDDIYSSTYYHRVNSLAMQSAGPFSEMIIEEFHPATAVDLGCGTGAMLAALRGRRVDVLGLDRSPSAIAISRRRGLEVREYDIESPPDFKDLGRFEVAVCTEVAEHVSPDFADSLVDQLVALSSQIVFTAAVPGQGGGVDHVNEQPHSYWIEKFELRGYEHLGARTAAQRQELLKRNVGAFYANNLMLFRHAPRGGRAAPDGDDAALAGA